MTNSNIFVQAWKSAAERKDASALTELLTDQARLISPISFKDTIGKQNIKPIFAAIFKILPDLTYTDVKEFSGGACLVFTGTLNDGVVIEGIDLFTIEPDGKACELKVFVRPLKAANLFANEMKKALS